MDQRTHTWLALRALGLIDQVEETRGLAALLKPHAKSAAIGSWLPDLQDSKLGSGDVDSHILKMKPYTGSQKERFTMPKAKLLERLGEKRQMFRLLRDDVVLADGWWNRPYKADPPPGQHLANRALSLSVTLIDLLILGDPPVAELVPGNVRFAQSLDPKARSCAEQVATYFFMLSHFVADACMPCHCDARPLAAYGGKLHHEWEKHWAALVGPYFEKKNLLATTDDNDAILARVAEVDTRLGLQFDAAIPKLLSPDVWEEMVMVCRASFAIDCILAPESSYPFDQATLAPYEVVFDGAAGQARLAELDRVILHDAVLNIAVVWKTVWEKFK